MNHVLELDEETFTATVEPGVVLIHRKASCSIHHMDDETLYKDTCRFLDAPVSPEEWKQVDELRKQACENVKILKSLVNHKEENK